MSDERPWKPSDLPSPFFVRHADALFAACESAIRAGRIDARSAIGDATLDYRAERDEMAASQAALKAARARPEAENARLRKAAQAVFDAAGNGEDELADSLVALGLALAALAPAADEGAR